MRVKNNLPAEVIARFQPPEVTFEQWRMLPAWDGLGVIALCLGGDSTRKASPERARAIEWLCNAVSAETIGMRYTIKAHIRGAWPSGVFNPEEVTRWAAPLFIMFPFEPDPEPAKPLRLDERETLLRIIKILADKAGLDLSQHISAGKKLAEHAAGRMKAPDPTTIGRKLKDARETD